MPHVCAHRFYGGDNELCAPCPNGATCDGYGKEPVAISGFYIGNLTLDPRDDGCHELHTNATPMYRPPSRARFVARERCLMPRACDPPESCTGQDMCGIGYVSKAPLYVGCVQLGVRP